MLWSKNRELVKDGADLCIALHRSIGTSRRTRDSLFQLPCVTTRNQPVSALFVMSSVPPALFVKSPFSPPLRILFPFTTCDFMPLRFSCSTSGRTMRNPTKVASVCHQMLWGRSGSWMLHSGFDPRRAARRCGACGRRRPTTHRALHTSIPRHRAGRSVRALASCRRGTAYRHRRRSVCRRRPYSGPGTIRPRCRAYRAGPKDWAFDVGLHRSGRVLGLPGREDRAVGLVPAARAQRAARPIVSEERITCGQLQEIPGSGKGQETAGSLPAPRDLPHAPPECLTRPRLQSLKASTFSR